MNSTRPEELAIPLSQFKKRRKMFLESIKQQHPAVQEGVVILTAACEHERYSFRQSSSFYYLTGIQEPAVVLCMFLDGREVLYVPNFGSEREKWVKVSVSKQSDPASVGVDEIRYLSPQVKGYSYSVFFDRAHYDFLLRDVESFITDKTGVFSVDDDFYAKKLFESWQDCLPVLKNNHHDVSLLLHEQRRIKDAYELKILARAIALTEAAQKKAAQTIKPGLVEYEVQAALEYVFTAGGADRSSFPSIVATGKNSTVLHYIGRTDIIQEGDLVVVDIGAEYGLYAADLTRTYPASGVFTKRQKEIYDLVLAAQEYIASVARPGMFLRNQAAKEQSLHYLTVKFFEKHGYAKYFPHGIGHYLGLEVHDVGDYTQPLKPGDVFTIEPGIYIPEESLGVRIEDNYLVLEQGVDCLSKALPSTTEAIEKMMREK